LAFADGGFLKKFQFCLKVINGSTKLIARGVAVLEAVSAPPLRLRNFLYAPVNKENPLISSKQFHAYGSITDI
jgi:hypothetical protein